MIGIAMISEMVATRHRGTLVASINVGAGGVGNFVSYGLFLLLLGPLAVPLGGNGQVWRWSFVILAAPALLVVLYRRRLPSPRAGCCRRAGWPRPTARSASWRRARWPPPARYPRSS